MIKSSVEKMAKDIGFDIANSDDVTQANLLDGFGDGMALMSENDQDTQACYIVNKLGPKAQKLIKRLNGFIELKEKD